MPDPRQSDQFDQWDRNHEEIDRHDSVGKWFATIAAGVVFTLILAAIVLLFVKGAIWFWNL